MLSFSRFVLFSFNAPPSLSGASCCACSVTWLRLPLGGGSAQSGLQHQGEQGAADFPTYLWSSVVRGTLGCGPRVSSNIYLCIVDVCATGRDVLKPPECRTIWRGRIALKDDAKRGHESLSSDKSHLAVFYRRERSAGPGSSPSRVAACLDCRNDRLASI